MSSRRATTTPYDDEDRWRSSGTPSRGRSGPHLGPIRITPARVFLIVALFGGLGFLAYSIFFRDALQVPLMASGFAVVGIVLGIAAFMSIGAVVTAGRAEPRRGGVLHRPVRRVPGGRLAHVPRRGRDHEHDLERDQHELTGTLAPGSRPVPPSSRGLGRHPFKVEIRGSNPLGGTTSVRPARLRYPRRVELMGVTIRTIVSENVAIRCDGCREIIPGPPGA